jgi:hypothetical protein
MSANKSITERIFQAIGFELLAILICTPLLAWIMDKPMLEMGAVTLVIAVGIGLERGLQRPVRPGAQAPGHCPQRLGPGGPRAVVRRRLGRPRRAADCLVAECQPVAGVLLDIGVLLFFLPYTYVYHWVYDVVRERVLMRQSCAQYESVARELVDRRTVPLGGEAVAKPLTRSV